MKNMKKLLQLAVIILLLACLTTGLTAHAAEADPVLVASSTYARQGEDYTTVLSIPANMGICDFQVSLNYNTELLTLKEAKILNANATANTRTTGTIILAYGASSNSVGQTDLIKLTFHIDDSAGIGTYDLLTLNEKFTNTASSVDDLTGAYEDIAVSISAPQIVIYEMGDVNLDQTVSTRDVSILKRHLTFLATSPTLEDFHLRIADAEKDGTVNMRDVARIMRHCAYYLDDIYGDRVNISFYDAEGNLCATRSVPYNTALTNLPAVPAMENYEQGQWSANPDKYVAPVLTNINKPLDLYAVYGSYQSDAIAHYKQKLTEAYYSGDLPTGLAGNLNLVTSMDYQKGYYAHITWQSSYNYVLNSTTGNFTKPSYPTELTLTASIVSYDNNHAIEAEDIITFTYQVPGLYSTPTKSEIATWLEGFFRSTEVSDYVVNYNLKLPRILSDEYFSAKNMSSTTSNFEVRIDWMREDTNADNGNADISSITEIIRTPSAQTANLVAVVTFNGKPLEGDGKIYFDDVFITPIEELEIRNHIISEIAANVSSTLVEGTPLWTNDTKYGTVIQWVSGQKDIADVYMDSNYNSVVSINPAAVNGSLVPLTAIVTYAANGEQKTFSLSYTASVETSNTLLEPGKNIDAKLYEEVKEALYKANGFTGNLTTDALKAQEFVSLDLSNSGVTSLNGLAYCINLRALNISGLRLNDSSINQIATLSELQALIARDCDLDNLSDGGKAVLSQAIYLELLDLSGNKFTSLNSVFDPKVTYGHLREVYLNDNRLEDISALTCAPALSMLSLGNNGLTGEDLAQLRGFTYLNYLSLANNKIEDISNLSVLVNLTELRLQHNLLTDVSALQPLKHLRALYLGHNQIKYGVEYLRTMMNMEVLYLNDNQITSISKLDKMSKLKAINVTNNHSLNDLSVLVNAKDTLTEIYAENNSLTSFNFIEGMVNLRILMLSGNAPENATESDFLTTQLSVMTKMETLTLSDKPLQDLKFLAYMPELIRLDIANCNLGVYAADGSSNIAPIVSRYTTLKILDIRNNPMDGYPEEIVTLRQLTNLHILYADNCCSELDITRLLNEMPGIRYLSMENCGITDLNWMKQKYDLIYVNLSGNPITAIDLDKQIAGDSIASLKYLYLDTIADTSFADAYDMGTIYDNIALETLSLKNVNISSISHLPKMDHLQYLNLAETDLTSLNGEDPDFYDLYTVARFPALTTLDVSGLELALAPVLDSASLRTLYAVDIPAQEMFYKHNLHTLQALYNKGVTSYLYDRNTVYAPVAQKEGTEILNLIPDFSCDITVAAEGMISDNNPEIIAQINNYDIIWTLSNTKNYEILNNRLAVKSYEDIDDEALIVTATILPYDDQETVSREFTINTHILRATEANRNLYYQVNTNGFGEKLQRNDTFNYDITLCAGETPNFSVPVKPVVDEIVYSYNSTLANGETVPYGNVLKENEFHSYTVSSTAPLHATAVIRVDMVHRVGGETIVDDSVQVSFEVVERTYTLTYVANGGTVKDSNGLSVESQRKSEESLLFADITVERSGYIFNGWYTDEALTQLYWTEGSDPKYMPAEDLTLYASWTAHSYTLYFNANGGTVSETSRLALCDQPIGTLPTPTRDYHDFDGWYTAEEGGTEVTSSTVRTIAENMTIYAHWTLKEVSGWVTSAPAGAQIISERWVYTKTTNTSSTATSMSGYTQTGSKWVAYDSGSTYYASFPSGFDPTHSYYLNWARGAYTASSNNTYKREVSSSWAGYVYWHWMYDCGGARGIDTRAIYNQKGTGPGNGYGYKYFGAFTSTKGDYSSSTGYCNNLGIRNYIVPERTAYSECQGSTRWFRFDYYSSSFTDYYKLFYYQKVENNLVSSTKITAGTSGEVTISNVVYQVQYRPK